MTDRVVHYEIEIFVGALYQPLCENNAGLDAFKRNGPVEMTARDANVTCPKCLLAMGDEERAVQFMSDAEQCAYFSPSMAAEPRRAA